MWLLWISIAVAMAGASMVLIEPRKYPGNIFLNRWDKWISAIGTVLCALGAAVAAVIVLG